MIVLRKLEESLTIRKLSAPELNGDVLVTRTALMPDARKPGSRASSSSIQRRFAAAVREHGLQIGLRITQEQTASLSISGMEVQESAEVADDLQRTFSVAPGERWVGFRAQQGGARRARKGRASGGQTTVLTLRGFRRSTAQAFQLMPVVLALGGQKFAEHHLLGVSVLYAEPRLVQTRVDSRLVGKSRARGAA